MAVVLSKFVQETYRDTAEWRHVEGIADRLLTTLNVPETIARIDDANRPQTASSRVQAAFQPLAEALGFRSERKGLFSQGISGLRPDFYLPLGDAGIILEVERGKTTTNNMDLLDFWKRHVCKVARCLFLVPQGLQHNPEMTPKKEYETVARRLAQFFEPQNYSNVRGLCLFGY